MSRIHPILGVAVLTAAALLATQPAGAEPVSHEAGHGSGPNEPIRVNVKPHGQAEQAYDLRKPDDLQKVHELLDAGEIEKLAAEEPINLFPAAWDLGIWTIVVFVLLLLVLSQIAWKPMLEGLKKREEGIHHAIHEAARLKEEAEALRRQLDQQMAEASEKVRLIHEEARKKAEEASAALLAQTRGDLKDERDRLYQELAVARDQALAELWERTASLATQASAQALRRSIDGADHRRLVDEALADIKNAAQERQRELASSRI